MINFNQLVKKQAYRDGSTTRFAPSPTGKLHIGGARNALLSWAMAQGVGGGERGKFILRIEDTDRARLVKGSSEEIIAGLKWLGIEPDETHVQSDRLGYYKRFLRYFDLEYFDGTRQRLGEETIRPYFCGMSEEGAKAVAERDANPSALADIIARYLSEVEFVETAGVARDTESAARAFVAGHRTGRWCRPWVGNGFMHLSAKALGRALGSDKYSVRLASMYAGETSWVGQGGTHTINNSGASYDAVLLKTDGYPTYFLGAGYDDVSMGIDLVIRGTEWQPSTPVYVAVLNMVANVSAMDRGEYEKIPHIWHVPVILDPSGKGKLSKRRLGDSANSDKVFLSDLAAAGYPPEAVRSWLLSSVLRVAKDEPYVKTQNIVDAMSVDGSTLTTQNQMINFGLLDRIAHIVMSSYSVDDLALEIKRNGSKKVRDMMGLIESLDAAASYDIIQFIGSRCSRYSDAVNYIEFITNPSAEYAAGRSEQVAQIVKANIELAQNNNVDGLLKIVVAETGMKQSEALSEIRAVVTARPISLPVNLALAAMNRQQLSRNIELCLIK